MYFVSASLRRAMLKAGERRNNAPTQSSHRANGTPGSRPQPEHKHGPSGEDGAEMHRVRAARAGAPPERLGRCRTERRDVFA